jgi:acyl-CoA thioester hydrolase
VNYWEQVGLRVSHLETGIGPMLASCACDFRAPLFFPGQVIITSRVLHIGKTSFSIGHVLTGSDGQTVAEAKDVMVMYDFNRNQKVEVTPELRARIRDVR